MLVGAVWTILVPQCQYSAIHCVLSFEFLVYCAYIFLFLAKLYISFVPFSKKYKTLLIYIDRYHAFTRFGVFDLCDIFQHVGVASGI